jgi:hypothetical protein
MTKRTVAELRLLMDAAQIAIAVGVLLVLALPWWFVYDVDGDRAFTGWGGLSDRTVAHGWLLLGAVAVALVAVVMNRQGAHIVACALAGLASLVMLLGLVSLRGSQDYDSQNGVWIGFVLLVATAVVQGFAAYGRE